MTDAGNQVVLLIDQGEDYVAYLFLTDDYGNPVPLTGEAGMTCLDANGQQLFLAQPTNNATTEATLTVLPTGFIQFSVPSAITETWPVGAYQWDLMAQATDNSVFGERLIKIAGGTIQVCQMLTKTTNVVAALT